MSRMRPLAVITVVAALAACHDAPTKSSPNDLAAITVLVPASTIEVGKEVVAKAIGATERGDSIELHRVHWESTNVAAVEIDSTGRMTGVGPGEADIVATVDDLVGRASITVTGPVGISSVTVGNVGLGASMTIEVATPRNVLVRYWDSTMAKPVSRLVAVTPVEPTITLYRLAPGRTYQYAVYAVPDTMPSAGAITGSFVTPPLPPDLATVAFDVTGATTDDLVMWEMRSASGWQGLIATDARGSIVWYYRTTGSPQGVARRANGNFILNDTGRGIVEITLDGSVVHALSTTAHHDVLVTPQNTVLYLGKDNRTVPGRGALEGDGIFEWTPESGANVQRFSTFDWFDPELDWGSHSQSADWLHANSIALGPHGNVVLSLNWISEIVSIAPGWQSLEWRLGGRNSSFAIDGNASFSGQHAASMPAEGRVLLFDNGREKTGSAQFSRGLELSLDPAAGRASLAWQGVPSPANFAPYLGYAKRLPNGNTLVHFGLAAGPFGDEIATGPIVLYEFTPSGGVAYRAEARNGTSCYRSWTFASLAGERAAR